MASTHVVQQGEHISAIAEKYHFLDYRTIWNDPGNAELRKLRGSPNVLLPGDRVQIPEHTPKTVPCQTGRVHAFRIGAPKLKLRIVVRDFDELPMPGLECELEVEGKKYPGKTDGGGVLESDISRTARKGSLRIPSLGLDIPVLIGHLDPPSSESGWLGRLANLGYWHEGDPAADKEGRLAYSLQEFQCDQGLKVTGTADAATKAKLAELHGS